MAQPKPAGQSSAKAAASPGKTTSILVMVAVLALLGSPSSSILRDQPSRGTQSQSGPFAINLVSAAPGGVAGLTLVLTDAADLSGYDLRLDFSTSGKLSGVAEDFRLNAAVLPPHRLGEHLLNQVRESSPGVLRLVCLDPAAGLSGAAILGNLRLAISADSRMGDRLPIRLTGQLLRRDKPVIDLAPLSVDLVVGAASGPTLTPFPSATREPTAVLPTASATPGSTVPTPGGTAAPFTARGKVVLERRSSSAGASACVGIRCVTTDSSGQFTITDLRVGDVLDVRHPSYLKTMRRIESAPPVAGGTMDLPPVTLLGGDVDQDGRVYDTDAGRIAGSWGQTPGGPRWLDALDVTADGKIGLTDMVAVQFNFKQQAPGPWTGSLRSQDRPQIDGERLESLELAEGPSAKASLRQFTQGGAVVDASGSAAASRYSIDVDSATPVFLYSLQLHFAPGTLTVQDADPAQPGVQIEIGAFFGAEGRLVVFNQVDPSNGAIELVVSQTWPQTGRAGIGRLAELEVTSPASSAGPKVELVGVRLMTLADDGLRLIPVNRPAAQRD